MAIERIFLGTAQPALHSVVDYLIADRNSGDWLDLSRHTLVTPGSRATRRLRELLFLSVRERGLKYLPPTITTIGSIPESLYESRLPFASEWVQQLTWARAVREVDESIRRSVFPQTTSATATRYSESDWLELGRLLRGTYRGLAAEALSFSEVAEAGGEMKGFPEHDRWVAMAAIQEEYLRLLHKRQLWDRQTARLRAIAAKDNDEQEQEIETDQQIVLIGNADIRRGLRLMLEQIPDQVTALVFAPEDWRDRFDDMGCIAPESWQDATIDFSNANISFVDSFSEQAAVATQALAELGDDYACNEVTIGCPDDRIVPHLQRSLAAHEINGREVKGARVTESPAFRFLHAIREALFAGSFDSYATLGRHPDVFRWLSESERVSSNWINQADAYRAAHLPTKATVSLGQSERRNDLQNAFKQIDDLLKPLAGAAQPMSQWSAPIAKVLKTVYGLRKWERSSSTDHLGVGAFRAISSFLSEQAALPPEVAPILTASEALELLLEQVGETHVAPPSDPDAIEMLGWLELPLDDAPSLVLTGLTEGIVPTSTTADLFLPNSLRQHLKIADNERRYARDAYALSVLLASRSEPKVQIIVSRVDDDGEPLRPSRLLFALPDEEVCLRWQAYFDRDDLSAIPIDPPATGESTATTEPVFGFQIPEPTLDCDSLTSISPTGFASYLDCPYRFYLKNVQKLRPVEDEAREMTGAVFGNIAHAVLEDFGTGAEKDSTDEKDIVAFLRKRLGARANRQFGPNPAAAVRVQLRQLELRLDKFAVEQAKVASEGWRILYAEKKSWDLDPTPTIESLDPDEGSLQLRGIIDRIDRNEDTGEYRILDYKSGDKGDKPEAVHRNGRTKEWKNLQLPLYRHIALAMDLEGVDDISQLNQVGYVLLPKKIAEVGFAMADWTESEFESADKLAREIVSKIIRKEYWPPLKPTYDDYASILMTTVQESVLES